VFGSQSMQSGFALSLAFMYACTFASMSLNLNISSSFPSSRTLISDSPCVSLLPSILVLPSLALVSYWWSIVPSSSGVLSSLVQYFTEAYALLALTMFGW